MLELRDPTLAGPGSRIVLSNSGEPARVFIKSLVGSVMTRRVGRALVAVQVPLGRNWAMPVVGVTSLDSLNVHKSSSIWDRSRLFGHFEIAFVKAPSDRRPRISVVSRDPSLSISRT